MKRAIAIGLFAATLAATVLAGLAWIDNMSIAWQWCADVLHGKTPAVRAAALAGNTADATCVPVRTYTGLIPAFDLFTPDISTVSTLVPFTGLLLIALGFWRILNKCSTTEDFPFFASYDRIVVSLGLLGTIWGIIMIGYYPSEEVQMANLFLCLHTALYASLIAIGWAFLIVIPVKTGMQYLHHAYAGAPAAMEDDLITVLEQLGTAATTATATLNGAGTEMATVRANTAQITAELAGALKALTDFHQRAGVDVEHACAAIGTTLTGMRADTQAWRGDLHNATQQIAALLEKETALIVNIETRLKAAEQQRAEAEASAARATRSNAQLEAQLTTARKALG